MADNWMLGETAALDDYISNAPTNYLGNAATVAKDWWTTQPSWLDRAKAENQRTLEAYGRGGMGEIAQQLATDTTEPQELYGAFGVGNIKGVRPPLAPGALAATSEYRPPFYSAVEQAVQGAKQNAAPGQQWAGFLRNQPGIKPEEVEALKLGKLFEQPGSVSKEAVLGEIAANRVKVGEVVKGGNEYELLDKLAQQHYGKDFAWVPVDQQRLLRNLAQTEHGQTKFSAYTLPGGENYREMLLTLPKKPKDIGPAPELLTELPKGPDWDNSYRVIRYRGDGPEREWGVIPPGQAHARAMAGQHPTEDEAVRQALNHINAQNAQRYNQELHEANKSGQFTSSHFDEPNVLAHVRYNDRVIDGKKTLFVEEVQSDWHQKGKRQGYKGELDDATKAEIARLEREKTSAGLSHGGGARYSELIAQIDRLRGRDAVPDAPFKSTWPELAMKRIIREAAEKGYDKVAWTPGSVQADRYDLSKHIDSMIWYRDGDGYRISAKKGDNTVVRKSALNENELADTIGKDLAEKIVKNQEQHGVMQGLDLKVGGEGMKGFYDEILPATVNKLVKKHGGRVGKSQIEQPTEWAAFDDGGRPVRRFPNEEQAMDYADAHGLEAGHHGYKPTEIHSLDITPSLRAAAMKGFPLFTAGGVAATGVMGEMARQDEYR